MVHLNRNIKMVVIGGSNGGVNAVLSIIKKLPKGLSVPITLVLHLSKRYSSSLSMVLEYYANFPVREPDDKEIPDKGVFYVSPPNYHLIFETNGHFAYDVSELVNYSRPSIDVLFETAAETFGDSLLGILLTGSNNDGAAGLMHIQKKGGYTIVQDPSSAESSEMPVSAINMFSPDEILNLDEIAGRIIDVGYGNANDGVV